MSEKVKLLKIKDKAPKKQSVANFADTNNLKIMKLQQPLFVIHNPSILYLWQVFKLFLQIFLRFEY